MCLSTPGIQVSVVNSYAATFENVPVNLVNSVDLPTEGKPIIPTLASPLLETSKPSYVPPPFFEEESIISLLSLASLAFKSPM